MKNKLDQVKAHPLVPALSPGKFILTVKIRCKDVVMPSISWCMLAGDNHYESDELYGASGA